MVKAVSFWIKLFIFTPCFIFSAYAQIDYSDFINESDEYRKAEIGLELVEYYARRDVDSLKILAADLFLLDEESNVELIQVVRQYSLGVF